MLWKGSESFSSMHSGQWFWIRMIAQIQEVSYDTLETQKSITVPIILLPAQLHVLMAESMVNHKVKNT